ncbi:MAG: sulfatase-like hydrolase/transferase [Actinobacteria bacterium]|nr:sulfatase-like hydrolase/transferase [Actinomycetota bacterium]
MRGARGPAAAHGRGGAFRAPIAALGLAALLSSVLVVTAAPPQRATASVRPNFVIVITDDQRFDTIGRCTGGFDDTDLAAGADACMPFLQQHLIANGTTFTRGYVTTSLCCPARASMLTGRYARHTGVINNQTLHLLDDTSTLATWLDADGYRTGLFGKYGNGFGEQPNLFPGGYVPPGWDSFHAFWGTPGYTTYSMVHRDPGGAATITSYDGTDTAPVACAPGVVYSTDFLCRQAVDFLAGDTTDPFFMLFAPFGPHLREGDRIAPSRWSSIYATVPQPRYPNYNVRPAPNPPTWTPGQPLTQTVLTRTEREFRGGLRASRAVDDAIGALVAQLAADGRLDSTVFFFLSDNGLARGEFRWREKGCEYEICHRVPFVVVCPATFCPGATPGTVDAERAVLNIDIAPTILDLAGLTVPGPFDGTSLLPILGDPAAPWRGSFLLEDHGIIATNQPIGIVSLAADGHVYKYVEFLRRPAEFELYDLTADPWELANLAGDGVHTAIQASLAAALRSAFYAPVLTITGGPSGITMQTSATFTWTSDEVADFECSLDGVAFTACGSGTNGSIEYADLGIADHTFRVRGTDADHNVSTPVQRSFTVTDQPPSDTSPPTVTMMQPTNDLLRSTTQINAAWSGVDDTGIVRFDVFERVGISGSQVLVRTDLNTSYARTGSEGTTYCYQVFAFDAAGNAGAGPERCTGVPFDDRNPSIVYTGTATPASVNGSFLNTLTVLDGAGFQAQLTFTGRRYGVLAQRGPSWGIADLYLDSVFVRRVDLYSNTVRHRQFLHQQNVALGTHTVTLVWTGDRNAASTGTAINLDGIALIG